MTKYETIAYYEALGDANKLVCVDSIDTTDEIVAKLEHHVEEKASDKFHIEVFHEEIGIQRYTVLKQTGENEENVSFDLWENMTRISEKISVNAIAAIIFDNMPKAAKSPYTLYIDSIDAEGNCTIKSFSDTAFVKTMPRRDLLDYSESLTAAEKILGEFDINGKQFHAINHADMSAFDPILDFISSRAIRLYAETCLHIIPDYVFEEPASDDSLTRPASDLAEGGLQRHLINAANIIHHLTALDYAKIKFSQHEVDMMIVAAMFHDFLKFGWQEDYNNDRSQKFEHPRLAANAMRCIKGIIPDNDIKFITNCVESHMGNNNIDHDNADCIPLPIPDTEYKYMVHLADYIATRKDLVFIHDDTVFALSTQKINTVKNFTPISDADKNILANAIEMQIDGGLASELDIKRDENTIKNIWRHIIETKRVTERQVKYVELAKRMMFY